MNGQRRLGSGTFLLLVILLGAFGPISTDMFLPALPDMVDEFDTTAAVMNMTLYGFMFSMAVSILLLGPVTDKYGRKAPLVICLAEYVVTTLLCAFVHDVGILIVLRVLQAIGAGAAMTLSTAFVKDCYSGAIRLKILNIVAIVGVLGPLLAPIAGAALISLWGWRATFIAPAVIALVCLVLALMLDETLPDGERVDGGLSDMLQGMKQLCCTPSFLVFTVMICLFNLPFMAYLSVSSYIYEGMFGVEPVAYSLILATTLMVGTVVMMLINRLTGNIVKRRIIGLYLVLGGFSGIATLLVGDTAWYVFFVCFSVCVAVNITIRPWGMGILMASHDGDSGAVSSLINFMFFLIGCIGMVLSTLPWKDYVFGLAVLICISSVLYALLWTVFKTGRMELKGLDGISSEVSERR